MSLLTVHSVSAHAVLPAIAVGRKAEATNLLYLPAELRLHIYSYLLPDVCSYTTGISEPYAKSPSPLRYDRTPVCLAILFTCRKIYEEAVHLLYHNHFFNFDIAGHLLRSVENRHNYITAVNFRAWLGLSSFFKQPGPECAVDNLDYTQLEDVCVNFWPVHGCPMKLDDARNVTMALCRKLRKASRLSRISIVFRDVWPAPQTTATTTTCRQMTEVEHLMQPFKVLRGLKEVHVRMPNHRGSGSALEVPFDQQELVFGDDGMIQSQLRCIEEAKVEQHRRQRLPFEIVVGHYNEDLSWLKEKSTECCIYSKGGPDNAPAAPFKFTPLPNIGREGHTFLYHIVNNYDTLADVTLFVQGRIDDHVDMTLEEMKKNALTTVPGQVTTYPFRELEVFDHWEGIPWDEYPCWKRWSSMQTQRMKETPLELFQQYIIESDRVPLAIGFAPGAIFAVRKETIKLHDQAFYERLLSKMFLGDMAHVNPETGHYMERFWLAMFNPMEYVQWEVADIADSERNKDGQLAKGRWYRTPMGSAIDLGALRRGEERDSPMSPISVLGSSPSIRSGSDTGLSSLMDDEQLEVK